MRWARSAPNGPFRKSRSTRRLRRCRAERVVSADIDSTADPRRERNQGVNGARPIFHPEDWMEWKSGSVICNGDIRPFGRNRNLYGANVADRERAPARRLVPLPSVGIRIYEYLISEQSHGQKIGAKANIDQEINATCRDDLTEAHGGDYQAIWVFSTPQYGSLRHTG